MWATNGIRIWLLIFDCNHAAIYCARLFSLSSRFAFFPASDFFPSARARAVRALWPKDRYNRGIKFCNCFQTGFFASFSSFEIINKSGKRLRNNTNQFVLEFQVAFISKKKKERNSCHLNRTERNEQKNILKITITWICIYVCILIANCDLLENGNVLLAYLRSIFFLSIYEWKFSALKIIFYQVHIGIIIYELLPCFRVCVFLVKNRYHDYSELFLFFSFFF